MRRTLAVHFVLCYVGNEFIQFVDTIPAMPCFQRFRKQNCGKVPEDVYYYEQESSRCQVGRWRGCLPALNMFNSEAECWAMCIGMKKPLPSDYHKLGKFKDNLLKNEVAVIAQSQADNDKDEDDNDVGESGPSGTGGTTSAADGATSAADGATIAGGGTMTT